MLSIIKLISHTLTFLAELSCLTLHKTRNKYTMTSSLFFISKITVLVCVVTTNWANEEAKNLPQHSETVLLQLVESMKIEIATLTNTVRNISDTTHILTNTVHSLTNTIYNLTNAVYNLTTINQAQEAKIKALEAGSSDIPAFMATLSRDLSDCSTDQFVVFDNAILNIGNVYDELHGVFRAPVSGTYQFSLSLSVPGDGNQYSVVIKKGTSATNVGYLYSNSYLYPYYLGRSTSILTQLEAGEDVWVACSLDGAHIAGGTGSIGQFYSHFSGFIVSL